MRVYLKLYLLKEPTHNTLRRLISFGIYDTEPFYDHGSTTVIFLKVPLLTRVFISFYQTIKAIVYYSVLFYLISDVPRCDLSLRNLLMFAFSLAVRYDLRLNR